MENEQKPHKIEQIMKGAMNELKTMIDVNTVIGKPIEIEKGVRIVPITKVIVGLVAGGGEYTENTLSKQKEKEYPFAAGSGSGFQIVPVGFLLFENGSFKILDIDTTIKTTSMFDVIQKVMNTLGKQNPESEVDDEA
jgi:sporulation protein YtfJ